jgi:hypothetical protein
MPPRVGICPSLQQQRRDSRVTALNGRKQRRAGILVGQILSVRFYVRLAPKEHAHDAEAAPLRRLVERRRVFLVAGLGVCAMLQESLGRLGAAAASGVVQWRRAAPVPQVHALPFRQQPLDLGREVRAAAVQGDRPGSRRR